MYDCIVVGAGPAGNSAAYHLAKLGRTVLIIEKASLPRYKACTGAVSPRIAEWFDFDFDPAIAYKLRQLRYTWKLGNEVTGELETEDPIWIVQRDVFDHFLAQQAIGQGADLKDHTAALGVRFTDEHWVVETPNGDFAGRYLVAADGACGPMSKWLGFEETKLKSAATLEVKTATPNADAQAMNFEFGLLKSGCLWCFPRAEGYVIGAATFLGKGTQDYQTVLEQYAPTFGGSYREGTTYPDALKLWEGKQPLHTRQAVVVGEAAAIVDPLTAEGIRHGIYSGVKAAEAIHTALQSSPDALADYTQAMHDWGDNMQWAQRIAQVFFRAQGLGYKVGIKRPTATKRMGQLLAGEIQYEDIANRVIKRISTGFFPGRK